MDYGNQRLFIAVVFGIMLGAGVAFLSAQAEFGSKLPNTALQEQFGSQQTLPAVNMGLWFLFVALALGLIVAAPIFLAARKRRG